MKTLSELLNDMELGKKSLEGSLKTQIEKIENLENKEELNDYDKQLINYAKGKISGLNLAIDFYKEDISNLKNIL